MRNTEITEYFKKFDWETILNVLSYEITEIFRSTFRREYLSLYEYKNCSLDVKIDNIEENFLFNQINKRVIVANCPDHEEPVLEFIYQNLNNFIWI